MKEYCTHVYEGGDTEVFAFSAVWENNVYSAKALQGVCFMSRV